jgi:hypothetical protein
MRHNGMVAQAFAERWAGTPTAWRLEREVDLIPLPGSVMVPDFRLVHPDGAAACPKSRATGVPLERAGVQRADLPV